jgi:hypothetical protein
MHASQVCIASFDIIFDSLKFHLISGAGMHGIFMVWFIPSCALCCHDTVAMVFHLAVGCEITARVCVSARSYNRLFIIILTATICHIVVSILKLLCFEGLR